MSTDSTIILERNFSSHPDHQEQALRTLWTSAVVSPQEPTFVQTFVQAVEGLSEAIQEFVGKPIGEGCIKTPACLKDMEKELLKDLKALEKEMWK